MTENRKPHEIFERNTDGPEWSDEQRRGFDDAYEDRPYNPPTISQENYDFGFQAAAYTVLEESYPGIIETTSLMHDKAKSSDNDMIDWLFLSAEEKKAWDPEGYLVGFEFTAKTIYG